MRDGGYREVQPSHSKQGSWVTSRGVWGICAVCVECCLTEEREKCRGTPEEREVSLELQRPGERREDGSGGAGASDTARGRCKEKEGFLRGSAKGEPVVGDSRGSQRSEKTPGKAHV